MKRAKNVKSKDLTPIFLIAFVVILLVGIAPFALADTETLRPVGAGTTTGMSQYPASGSNWDKVDDNPSHDANSTYVYTSTQDVYDLYEVANHSTGSGDINSVTIHAYVARLDGQATKTRTVLRTEDTNDFGTGTLINTQQPDYEELTKTYTTNPNTGQPWTWTQVDAMEIGIQNLDSGFGGAHTIQCTQIYAVVDYTPGASSPTTVYSCVCTNAYWGSPDWAGQGSEAARDARYSTRHYTSLSAWESARNRDLTAANEIEVCEIVGDDWTSAVPTAVPLIPLK